MTDYMKNQGLVDAATGSRNRQRELEAEIKELRECELDLLKRLDKAEDEVELLRDEYRQSAVNAIEGLRQERERNAKLQAVVDAAKAAWRECDGMGFESIYELETALVDLENNDE